MKKKEYICGINHVKHYLRTKTLVKIILGGACVFAIGYYTTIQSTPQTSDLVQQNIEALANSEAGDCHYENGYTAFTSKDGGAYDCCKVWVSKKPDTDEGHCR